MKSINVSLGDRSYTIQIGENLLNNGELYQSSIIGKQVVIVTNEIVAPLYLESVQTALHDKEVHSIILPDGEHTKTLSTADEIFTKLLEIPCDRHVTIVALGGGVIGDMSGFSAACYQRGVAFIQIPTTLLSQVDSSVGGKTAVNHALGKNMIGAFYQPKLVLADTGTLTTLDDRQFSSGLAEVIKYGLINDSDYFDWIELNINRIMNREPDAISVVIERSCLNKARIVEQDEKESGVRALLNLGHTFGHAIENGFGYGVWLHGEAVAMGMVMAAEMSRQMGWLTDSHVSRVKNVLCAAKLPTDPFTGLSVEQIMQLMTVDKKVSDGQVRLVLMQDIGQSKLVSDYPRDTLISTLEVFVQ